MRDVASDAVFCEAAPRSPARRFCLMWIVMTAGIAALAGALDAAVDPFLVVGSPRISGLNAVKPGIETHSALAKRHLIGRTRPAGLVLGDSKADIGIDPGSSSWPEDARPVFNDALPGLGIEGVFAHLRADAEAGAVRRVLVVLDLQNLMSPPGQTGGEDGEAAPGAVAERIGDLALATLSLDALGASVATLAAQSRPDVVDMTPEGATGEGGFRAVAARDGYSALFEQKDAQLSQGFQLLAATLRGAQPDGTARIGAVADMIAFCRDRGVRLDLMIPPVHADYLEALSRAGLWPRYEAAKRDLTRAVAAAGDDAARLWDFGSYSAATTEIVPGPSDRRSVMEWYWDPEHFKKRLGEKLLATIYGGEDGLGVRLTPDVVEARLAADERAKADYEASGRGSRRRLSELSR